ncbi:MAG: extracellular solute-binding protein [Spirochaetales bacterium]|nr:extracellular solute-binding protein [Spirochaetales bacterium]
MKKLLMVFGVLLVAMCVLFAQGSGEKAAESDSPKTEDGKIIVPYWRCYTGSSAEFVDGIIAEFNASQDKYEVVPEYNGGYYDQFAKLMSTDRENLPAMCNSSSETVGSYLHSGLVKYAQDFIDADKNWSYNFYGNLVATYGVNGRLVGIPLGFSLSGFFYNAEIFEAAGIDPYSLTSFDRVYEAALKIGDGGYAKYAISEEHSGIWANYCFHREGLYTVDNNNGVDGLPTKVLYNEEPLKTVCYNYYKEWADLGAKGYVYPVGAKVKTALAPALGAKEVAMIITTNSYKSTMNDVFSQTGGTYGFVPMFSATDNGKQTGFCSSGNGFFIINNGHPDQQQGAYEFIKYFDSPSVQLRWMAKTGYLPMYDAVAQTPEYKEILASDNYTARVLEELGKSDYSAFYAFTAVNNIYSPAGATCLEAVINGADVQASIDQMCETINEAFKMYNLTNK